MIIQSALSFLVEIFKVHRTVPKKQGVVNELIDQILKI